MHRREASKGSPKLDDRVLVADAEADGRRCVVGAIILDTAGRAFVHRRGADRAFLPGCWDLVGGHVEAGETLLEALAREIEEETGWHLAGSPQLAYVCDWLADETDPLSGRREFDFLADIDGDLAHPTIEWPKHVEFRWIGTDEIALLDENRGADGGIVRDLVELGLRSARRGELTDPHATIFLDPGVASPIEELRVRWDPAMAGQIAAHVTVAFPAEVDGVSEMLAGVVSARREPFRLRLGDPTCREGRPEDGVMLDVHDVDGDWTRLREAFVPPSRRREHIAPHVTLVHPRTTNRGAQAWEAIRHSRFDIEFTATELAVTAFDGRVWKTVERVALGRDR